MRPGRILLALALAATLVAVGFAPSEQGEVVAPRDHRDASQPALGSGGGLSSVDVLEVRARGRERELSMVFGSQIPLADRSGVSNEARGNHPVQEVATPMPAIEPIFRMIGYYRDEAGDAALLQGADRSFSARPGDVLDARFRVDSLAPGELTMTDLTLNVQKRLKLNETP